MSIEVNVQYALSDRDLPTQAEIAQWVQQALMNECEQAELTVRIVDNTEGALLNEAYRAGRGATNVLSFPFEGPEGAARVAVQHYLGDLVVCAPVVKREAQAQRKDAKAHWAHMVVHGSLHLLGYDHNDDAQAAIMEALETAILDRIGYPNPYLVEDV